MKMKSRVEFYLAGRNNYFCGVDAEFQPNEGDLVNIRKVTYKVLGRSFTVDHADDVNQTSMCCNVTVEEV
jgi:hypothetical protein